MKYATLGRSGVQVSKIALGSAVFGVSPQESDVGRIVGRALDLGINLFDTANSYGNQSRFDRPGAPPAELRKSSEELLGAALKNRRHEVILCSKVMEPIGSGANDRGLSRRHIMEQVERSLTRLQTDYLDVYHAHHPDPAVALEETLLAFDDLIRQGKIRYYALSTFGPSAMTEVLWVAERLGLHRPVCNQVPYNLAFRNAERELLGACRKFGVSLTCYSALAGGLLAGTEVLKRPISGAQRWGGPAFSPAQIEIASQLDDIAEQNGFSTPQLALAWLLSRDGVASAIIGPETLDELEANAAAGNLDVPAEVIEQVDQIGRLPFSIMAM